MHFVINKIKYENINKKRNKHIEESLFMDWLLRNLGKHNLSYLFLNRLRQATYKIKLYKMKTHLKITKNKYILIGYTKLPENKRKYFLRIKDNRRDIASCW